MAAIHCMTPPWPVPKTLRIFLHFYLHICCEKWCEKGFSYTFSHEREFWHIYVECWNWGNTLLDLWFKELHFFVRPAYNHGISIFKSKCIFQNETIGFTLCVCCTTIFSRMHHTRISNETETKTTNWVVLDAQKKPLYFPPIGGILFFTMSQRIFPFVATFWS